MQIGLAERRNSRDYIHAVPVSSSELAHAHSRSRRRGRKSSLVYLLSGTLIAADGASPPAAFLFVESRLMRHLLLFLPVAALLSAADLKIDHATVAGTDVKRMQDALKLAGIDSVYGGPHSNHASEMALVSFPDGTYLELMGIQPNADPAAVASHEWSKWLKGDAGPCAWALRERDIAAEVARLKAAGVPVSGSGEERAPAARRRQAGMADQHDRRSDPRHVLPVSDSGPDPARAACLSARQSGHARLPRASRAW